MRLLKATNHSFKQLFCRKEFCDDVYWKYIYLLLSVESDQKNMCVFSCECPFNGYALQSCTPWLMFGYATSRWGQASTFAALRRAFCLETYITVSVIILVEEPLLSTDFFVMSLQLAVENCYWKTYTMLFQTVKNNWMNE